MYIIRVTLGSNLPAFSASRQLMTQRQKADAVTSSLNITAVSGRSGARLMLVISQREPGDELYVRPGTSALLSDSLHNICPTGQNLRGRITTNSGGTRPPVPPVFTPMVISRIGQLSLPSLQGRLIRVGYQRHSGWGLAGRVFTVCFS